MNPRSYEDLVGLIQEHPMTDGDAWLKLLLAKNEMLGEGMLPCCQPIKPICLSNLSFANVFLYRWVVTVVV